jgi:Tfp pilus assembly pilus retraction ATPase PilT
LISNSNFKIQFEFEKVFNIKLVELEIMKISYFGNFSGCYTILRVIWQKPLNLENLGGATVLSNQSSAPSGMGTGKPPWPSASF